MKQMKDSGIEWIGKIPENWTLNRLLWCMEEVKEKNDPIQTTNVLSLTNKLGVIPYEEKGNQGNKAKEDYSEYGLAFKNTLVINSMNVLIGSVGISNYYGCVSPVYYVFRNTPNSDLGFINYIFQTIPFQKELRNYANGILEIRLRISSHDMLRRIIPYPTLSDQKAISAYLDRQCAHIDNIIEKTKASIEEYKKLRQAVISETLVSKGKAYKLSSVGTLKNGLNYHAIETKNNIKILGVGNFQENLVLNSAEQFSNLPIDDEIPNECLLQSGDIVFVRSNGSKDLVGRSVMVENIDFPLTYSGFCIRFRNERTDIAYNKYLLYFFRSFEFRESIRYQCFGTNISNLSQDMISSVKIMLPTINEQIEIATYLDRKCSEIANMISKKEQFISELDNYKKSIIYEYVTGKKEVAR